MKILRLRTGDAALAALLAVTTATILLAETTISGTPSAMSSQKPFFGSITGLPPVAKIQPPSDRSTELAPEN